MPRDFLDHEPVFNEASTASNTSDANPKGYIQGDSNYVWGRPTDIAEGTVTGDYGIAFGAGNIGIDTSRMYTVSGGGGGGGSASAFGLGSLAIGGAGGVGGTAGTFAIDARRPITRTVQTVDGQTRERIIYNDGSEQERIVATEPSPMRPDMDYNEGFTSAQQIFWRQLAGRIDQRRAVEADLSSQRRLEALSQMRDLSRSISISNKPTINPTRDTQPRPTLKQRLLKFSFIKWFFT